MSDERDDAPSTGGPRRWMDRELVEIVHEAVRRMEAVEDIQRAHDHVLFGVREHPETGLLARFLEVERRLDAIDSKLNKFGGGLAVLIAAIPFVTRALGGG